MSEERKTETISAKKWWIIVLTVIVAFGIFAIIGYRDKIFIRKATTNDISGDWNSSMTTCSYVFIPKRDIDDLEVTFSIRDNSNKELQSIVKRVGNVQKGQQYTVSLSVTEFEEFATLMNAEYTTLTVTNGKARLI